MATWITHLRIAENFLRRVPGLEAGPFAIGNIAPDSGIPDANWEKFTPDPKVTHFLTESSTPNQPSADLTFYRQYLAPLKTQPVDAAGFSFRLGYFFHLVSDNLWSEAIGKPTQERWREQFLADPHFIWEVKGDWYGQDFIYVQTHPASLFWSVFLAAEPDTAGLDFLPLDALSQRVHYIQEYYQRRDEEIVKQVARPMIYLSTAELDHFVALAGEKIEAIYDRLWVNNAPTGDALTAMDWINPQ